MFRYALTCSIARSIIFNRRVGRKTRSDSLEESKDKLRIPRCEQSIRGRSIEEKIDDSQMRLWGKG